MIAVEFSKQWRRPRTVATLAALVGFTLILTIALRITGSAELQRVGDIPLLVAPGTSGIAVPVIALSSTMKFFLPLAVAIFAGESIAGEASWGGLRYALAGPRSRTHYLLAKLVVALLLSLVAVLVVSLSALLWGTIAFGVHPFAVIDGSVSSGLQSTHVDFGWFAALGRLGLGTAYVTAGMLSIFSFSFLLSTITSRPFAAVAGGVGLTVISRVLNADYLPGVSVLSPYLPNNDVDLWQHFFQRPADTTHMARFLTLQGVYSVVSLSFAWWWFRRRDILS
ncbi:MAG: ABC transporter permease [Solirubrobacteraceae bacterium]